ncbi:hypothetical protein [Filimonas effusa]|uniref:Uncharacterized protein n=1 Tax=Filimonas effusa TaxID=2508721 RepID=A0A4Q1DF04_9BACT|nr:hypothetical protein [Filimonas effusa]RXK87273.1 hypothetical protein ESB13_10965 [Filimonas effusa]
MKLPFILFACLFFLFLLVSTLLFRHFVLNQTLNLTAGAIAVYLGIVVAAGLSYSFIRRKSRG